MKELNNILNKMVRDFGIKIFENSQKFKAVFSDYSEGELHGERELIIKIIEIGSFNAIVNADDLLIVKKNLVKKLHDEYFIDEKICTDLVNIVASFLRNDNINIIENKSSLKNTDVQSIRHFQNESVIVLQRKKTIVGIAISMKVWVDDIEVASSIRNGQNVRINIANGDHLIKAGSTFVDKGKGVPFSVIGEEITFFAEPQVGILASRFKLTEVNKNKL